MNVETRTEESIFRLSSENIIELIRDHRNEFIKSIMSNDSMLSNLQKHYIIYSLSPIKEKFIRQILIDLSKTPLDLNHYSKLILEIRKKDSHVLNASNENFFIKEVEKSIANYLV